MTDSTIHDLRRIQEAARLVCGRRTLDGTCSAVALAVRAICGGLLLRGLVSGAPHFWNILPCGTEVDLTNEQFGGDGWHPMTEGEAVEIPQPIPLPHLLFIRALTEKLSEAAP